MGRRGQRAWLVHFTSGFTALLCLAGLASPAYPDDTGSSEPALSTDSASVEERLLDLERKYSVLADENRRLSLKIHEQPDEMAEVSPVIERAPPVSAFEAPLYDAGYDNGFYISPRDPEQFPFELRFNSQDQLRYAGFARNVRTWTDSAGIVSPVTDRSRF